MKYHFHRDTIMATIFFFVVLWLLSATVQMSILEPGKIELPDFDHTDIVFSQLPPNPVHFDPKVVVVNVGTIDRAGIAAVIQATSNMQPAAMGVDLTFTGAKDPAQDSMLIAAIAGKPNIVMCSELAEHGNKEGYFDRYAQHRGYGNFYGEAANMVRYFRPFHGHDTSLTAAVLNIANPQAFARLYKRDHDVQTINYTRRDSEYLVIDYRALLNGLVDEQAIKGKIVLVGVYDRNPNNIEDKHLTPMNHTFIGRTLPDMHGVMIHANILSMMLADNYISRAGGWISKLLGVLLCWICMGVLVKYIVNKHIWFHIIVKVWQSVAIFVLFALNILLFKYGHVKLDVTLALSVLIFAPELLYLYEIFAMWLESRFNHKTIFKSH